MTMDYSSLFLDGAWLAPRSAERITVRSASTEEVLGSVPDAGEADADRAVFAARRAFDDPLGWSRWTGRQRAEVLEKLADALETRRDEMARRVSSQNGMPITMAAAGEADLPVWLLRHFAGVAAVTNVEHAQPSMRGGTTWVLREALGVVAAITPWNAPQSLASFKYAPALAAGCTVVIKPSPETVLDANLLAEAAADAGLPPGVLNVLPAGRDTSRYLVAHPEVDKIAFTGSTATGRAIAEVCGRLLRPATLELGGKSAAVFLDDVDLTAPGLNVRLASALLGHTGQTCYLGTRVLVPRGRHDEITEYLAAFVSSLEIGDPLDPATQLGPLVTAAHRDRVEGFIERGRADGGTLVTGGGRPAGQPTGWYLEPTVFTGLDRDSVVAREEIFGPVLTVLPYADDDDAVRIANDSPYGLGGSVWTADPERGHGVARRVRTGTIGINGYRVDPGAPFGGMKDSGLGRELGPAALAGFQEVKAVYG
ncbi:aldehyde dehydrogenase [Amycolatopsis sp. NPDC047767]|uniref:aldehyde dehydrogenase n=1 Tax=Amycolatopsis sp. NPDC047767 TaxID=3156765 RepID=UPI0034539998